MTPRKKPSKVRKVMKEYKQGTLRSSSGSKVKSRSQAIAIAMSEAGMSKNKKKKKVPKGYHRMPDGKLMKGSRHKGGY